MSTGDYYKNLWTTTQGKGAQFFKTVNFITPPYQYQENIFRAYLDGMILKNEIKSVLELGAGTGRMTKIVLEELGTEDFSKWPNPNGIQKYDCIELNFNQYINKMKEHLGRHLFGHVSGLNLDITSREFDLIFDGKWGEYDLILASEVFMHIKPQDIDKLIEKLSKMGKQIINIDWTFDPDPNAEWYFIHDYEKLYEKYGAQKITRVDMKRIQQSLFHYRFGGI